eukprot:sb/3469176/
MGNNPINYSGHYRVMVQLTTLTLEGSMQFAVTSALPSIVFNLDTYVGRTGEQLIFTIAVSGNPEPEVSQIEWYIGETRVQQGDNNIRFSDDYRTLFKSSLTEADAGYVKVVVETSAGRSEKSAEILVIKQDDISPTKSTVKSDPDLPGWLGEKSFARYMRGSNCYTWLYAAYICLDSPSPDSPSPSRKSVDGEAANYQLRVVHRVFSQNLVDEREYHQDHWNGIENFQFCRVTLVMT